MNEDRREKDKLAEARTRAAQEHAWKTDPGFTLLSDDAKGLWTIWVEQQLANLQYKTVQATINWARALEVSNPRARAQANKETFLHLGANIRANMLEILPLTWIHGRIFSEVMQSTPQTIARQE